MLNKKMLASMLVALPVVSFAQDLTSTTPAEATPAPVFAEPAAAPAPVYAPAPVAAPAAKDAGVFDKLRGRAYGDVVFGNAAAAFTVGDYLDWPHMMGGSKFLYVEPAGEYGTVSGNIGDKSVFMNMDMNDHSQPRITLGLAQADGWGLGLRVAKDRTMTSTEQGATQATPAVTTDVTTVGRGDQLGLTFSTKLGGNAFNVSADWITVKDEVSSEAGNNKNDQNYSEYLFEAHYANFYANAPITWILGASFDRYALKEEAGSIEAIPDDARTAITLSLSAGGQILGNETSRVLVGMDDSLAFTMWDDQTAVRDGAMQIDLIVAPNIVGEYSINENWMVMGGAKHSMLLLRYGSSTDPADAPGSAKTEESEIKIENQVTTASAGIRYERTNLAVEASLTQRVFSEGTAALFTTGGSVATVGAFLYF